MHKRPTLKTISELSGLAIPTVSRALNDAPDIGAKTKTLVKRIAAEIDYRPDRAGLRLRTGRTNVISLVFETDHDILNQTSHMISMIANALSGTHFHLNMMPFLPGENPLIPIKYIVETGAADCVIFNQVRYEDPRVAYLLERKFPFVTHGRSRWASAHAYFDYDNRAFTQKTLEFLFENDANNILLIIPPLSQNYAMEMKEGAEEASTHIHQNLHIPTQITSDSPNTDVRHYVRKLLSEQPQTNAIVAGSLNSAVAAYTVAQEMGLVVGRDLQIITKEAMPFFHMLCSDVITIQEDIQKAGEFLAKAAISLVKDKNEQPMQYLDQMKCAW